MSNTEKKCRFVATKRKWISFGLWTLVFILFVVWTGSLWWLLPIPFAFDLFISRYIPWSFWKKSKNKTFRVIMDWVDAIVFALVAVYFVFLFFFQNYQIPSSSLEKSLLVGDYLFVSKLSYGPRMPNTPLSFPLAQHTLPIVNSKSYFEKPQWPYKRIKGLGKIQRKDIVVFNFPAGDTVALKMQNTDYYTICYSIARERGISMQEAARIVRTNPQTFGEIVYRPVDRRENYVKRCVGLPGDSLQIISNQVYINGKILEDEPGTQYNYFVQTKGSYFSEAQFRQWNISKEDRLLFPEQYSLPDLMGFEPDAQGNKLPVYHFPATKEVIEKIKKNPMVNEVRIEPTQIGPYDLGGSIFTLSDEVSWTRDDFGPLWIPCKGATIELNPANVLLYGRVICAYERHSLEERQGLYFIDGEPAEHYTFEMDYYWMMGDNRHNSADSRAWGFVPEDHVVGKPMRVWLSLDKDRNWFQGKIRWKRFMKKAV
ncbi:MAG: signal peptidase I [Bacteroidales bacterium]|nr:signal peptidase I [Bacteroidales bacterium]